MTTPQTHHNHNHKPTTKMDDDENIASDNTLAQTTKVTLNCLRCGFRITVPKSIHLDKSMVTVLKNISDQMKDINSTVQIPPWTDKSTSPILKKLHKSHIS